MHEDSAAALRNDPAVQAAYLGAGGAAAPHTHDAAQGPSGRDAVPSEAAPQAFAVSPRPSQTVSADAILGRSVADLVAQASQRQQSAVTDRRQTAPAQAAQQNDRIAATLAEIERAAQAARRPRVVERSRPQDRARDSAPQTSQQQDSHPASPPVTIEVYRAPRVEVWRRRPGGNDFDRS